MARPPKNVIFRVFRFSPQKLSPCVPTSAVQEKSSTRFTAVTRLTVYRRFLYLVELFGIAELEEFRRGVELAGRPGQKRQSDNFWVVLQLTRRASLSKLLLEAK
eukprot:6149607-Pyramimonas_sp.AAC.1